MARATPAFKHRRAVLQMVVGKTTAVLLQKVERFIFKYPKSPESQQQPYLKVKPQQSIIGFSLTAHFQQEKKNHLSN